MPTKPIPPTSAVELRRRAEARLRERGRSKRARAGLVRSAAEARRLLHELQVHQIELEMQNAQLQSARDQMEVELEKYSELYDFAPVGYLTLGRDGVIREANLAGANLLGIARAALVRQRFGVFVAPADRAGFDAFLRQVFASGAREECDLRLLVKDRPPVDVRMRANLFNQGEACRVAVTDITKYKAAEDKVRVSEIRYRRLFEATHNGVLLLDPATCKITDANPFMTRLLGYPRDQLVGKELFEIGLLKDAAASRQMFQELKKDHEVRYEDLPLETQGGRHQEVEVVANLYEENGHAVIQCNIRDITKRKQAEDLLRRNEALFSALIEQAPVGVYVVDAGFRLLQVNPKARPIFAQIHPLIGRDFSEVHHILWPKRISDPIVERFRQTLKTGIPYQAPEFTARRLDIGVTEVYEWQIQRVTLPAGEYGVVCFFNNITERKKAEGVQRRLDAVTASNRKLEQEIIRRQAMETALRQSEQQAHQLLAQSHQLQKKLRRLSHRMLVVQENQRKEISRELHDKVCQLLVGINVHLAVFARNAATHPKGIRRTLAPVRRMVEKSVRIVHQFARELRPATLDDLGLIPALCAYLEDFPKRKGRKIQFAAFAGVEALDNDKRTVLYRVTQEALINVDKHAHARVVKVIIKKVPGGVCLEVSDDGRAFDVSRLTSPRWSRRLGLIGMRERVEMVGGRFSVESTPGVGTTVRAEIPSGKAKLRR